MSFKIINSKDSSHYLTIQKSSAFRNTGSKVSENDKSYFGNKATHKNGFYPEDIEQALIELSKDRSIIVLDIKGKPYDKNPNVSRDGDGDFILSNDYYEKLKVFTRLESDNSSKDLAESMNKLRMIISSAKENSADNKQALRNFNANVIKGFLQTNDMETLQAKVKVEVANLEASLKFNSPSWWDRTINTIEDGLDKAWKSVCNFFKRGYYFLSSMSTSDLQKRQAALELELKSREITDEPTVQQLKDLMADFDNSRAVGVNVSAATVEKFIENNQEYKSLIRTISNQGKENSTALAIDGTVQKEVDATLKNISSAIEGAYKAKEFDDEKARNGLARENKFKANYKPGVAKNRTQETIDAHKMNFSSDLEKYFDERREIENRSSIKNNDNVNLDAKSVDHADQIKTRTNTTSTTLTTHLERYKDGVCGDSKNNENKSESNSDNIINQENLTIQNKDTISTNVKKSDPNENLQQREKSDSSAKLKEMVQKSKDMKNKKVDNLLKFITENTNPKDGSVYTYRKEETIEGTLVRLPRCILKAYEKCGGNDKVSDTVTQLKNDIANPMSIIEKLSTYMAGSNTEYNGTRGYNTYSLNATLKQALSDGNKLSNALNYGSIEKPVEKKEDPHKSFYNAEKNQSNSKMVNSAKVV
ncbi:MULTISPECIES: hypothetical protein [Cysteiniphilum]|uniref:Uncharacterized protein n=1 Tax=Cysteiniphilum litorale TaxID=2056700 RepID=A0A8J3E9P9_9GAMM|nr:MULTISPECIES: hypothetical protein [Cysteiniphilum]GGG01177.1 hypothetical protein GCM10010995_18260 [Cysteiniphilum litorale]